MKVSVHSLDKTLYEGDATTLVLPTESGEVSILEGHIPLVTALSEGTLRIKESENNFSNKVYSISGGFAEVTKHSVTVLAK